MGHAPDEEWIERAGRIGYAAKGLVFTIVGWIAVQAAVEARQQPRGSRGALQTVLEQPFGRVLLGVLAVGLAAYVVWRWIQAFVAPEQEGDDGGAKQVVKRVGYFISGVIYGVVGFAAARAALGGLGGLDGGGAAMRAGGAGGQTRAEHWTAMVMQYPLGRWVIAVVGALVIAYGLYSLYRAVAKDIGKRFDLTPLGGSKRPWVVRLGRFGIGSRGVVFGVIGTFLIIAALQYDPDEARGLGEALRMLERQPYGSALLTVIGLGLIAYGLFQFAKARYRRIPA